MKRIVMIAILMVLAYQSLGYCDSTDKSMEYILNRVFNSSNNTLNVE